MPAYERLTDRVEAARARAKKGQADWARTARQGKLRRTQRKKERKHPLGYHAGGALCTAWLCPSAAAPEKEARLRAGGSISLRIESIVRDRPRFSSLGRQELETFHLRTRAHAASPTLLRGGTLSLAILSAPPIADVTAADLATTRKAHHWGDPRQATAPKRSTNPWGVGRGDREPRAKRNRSDGTGGAPSRAKAPAQREGPRARRSAGNPKTMR